MSPMRGVRPNSPHHRHVAEQARLIKSESGRDADLAEEHRQAFQS
jgi:hypothetical protein